MKHLKSRSFKKSKHARTDGVADRHMPNLAALQVDLSDGTNNVGSLCLPSMWDVVSSFQVLEKVSTSSLQCCLLGTCVVSSKRLRARSLPLTTLQHTCLTAREASCNRLDTPAQDWWSQSCNTPACPLGTIG
eukprot:1159187-Pelagomonas_calceolata.AAC.5